MWCIMFQLLHEMGTLLWPEHQIYVAVSATDVTFITEKNLWTGYGMSNSTDPCWHHLNVHSKKMLADSASLSSLSSCGLMLLTMAYKALMIIPASTTMGERWMETAAVVLCKLKLNLGVYCVGVRWLLTHLVYIFLCLSYSFLLVAVWWPSYTSRCFSSFTTADSGNILKFTSEGIFSECFRSFGKPSTCGILNWILWPSKTEVFKTHKNGTVLGKLGKWDPYQKTHVVKVLDMKLHKN